MKKISLIILLIVTGISQTKAQCACCSGGSSSGFSGGESTPGIYVLGKNKWVGEIYSEFRSFNGLSNIDKTENGTIHLTGLQVNSMNIDILGIRYGITDRLSVMIQQPMFVINGPAINSKTFGDLLSLVNYIPVKKPGLVVSATAGIEWPTGQMVNINNGSSISTGSGSYDPVAGLSLLKPLGNSLVRASVFYKHTTKGFNGIYYGDFCGQQINYSVFLFQGNGNCLSDSLRENKISMNLNVQLSGEWAQAQIKDNIYIPNTGSYIVLGSAGATVSFKGFSVPVMLSVPVTQNLNGQQNMTRFRLRIGITKKFN